MNITDRRIPEKRPHFSVKENDLYFLISSRPFASFTEREMEVWNAIDGQKPVSEIVLSLEFSMDVLLKFHQLGLIEFIDPVRSEKQRKKVVIVEPHMDDAVLSVGGIMWMDRENTEFIIVTAFSVSNFTSYYRLNREYYDTETVTLLRKNESELILRMLGGQHLTLDHYDAPLRYNPGEWSCEWHKKNKRALSAFQNSSPVDREVERLSISMENVLSDLVFDEIWIPAGIGTSSDHETTRNASLRLLARNNDVRSRGRVYIYQDVPYLSDFPSHFERIAAALTDGGAVIEKMRRDVTGAFNQKLRLLSIFGSQFKPSYMEPKVKQCNFFSSESNETQYVESLFELVRFPTQINEKRLYSGADYVDKIKQTAPKWIEKHQSVQDIRVLCPIGFGKWKNYLEYLLLTFPNAIFEVYLTEDTVSETQSLQSERIRCVEVSGLHKGWLKVLFKVFFSAPKPTIICSHQKLFRYSKLLSRMLFFSSPIVVSTMEHLIIALKEIRRVSSRTVGEM